MSLGSASSVVRSLLRSLARTVARNVVKKIARNVALTRVASDVVWNIAKNGHGRNAVRMLGGIGDAPGSLEALLIADRSTSSRTALLFLTD